MGVQKGGGADSQDAAVAFRQGVDAAGMNLVDAARQGGAEDEDSYAAQPHVADAVAGDRQSDADAPEKQDGENPLSHRSVDVIGDKSPGVAAQVVNRRIRINRVAGPIRRRKAAQR